MQFIVYVGCHELSSAPDCEIGDAHRIFCRFSTRCSERYAALTVLFNMLAIAHVETEDAVSYARHGAIIREA
jgi:hypothetical protein